MIFYQEMQINMRDPNLKFIFAKFDCICCETGVCLKRGTEILYDVIKKKAYSVDSARYRGWIQDAQKEKAESKSHEELF
jgi:hypothetical protein